MSVCEIAVVRSGSRQLRRACIACVCEFALVAARAKSSHADMRCRKLPCTRSFGHSERRQQRIHQQDLQVFPVYLRACVCNCYGVQGQKSELVGGDGIRAWLQLIARTRATGKLC